MNLSVRIGKLVLKNPVTVASGTFGYAEKYYSQAELGQLGALIPKTITLHARVGNPPPRIAETPSGMLNAIGLENAGADVFITQHLPALVRIGVPVIASISGSTDREFVSLAEKCGSARGIAAVELNLSCPNLGKKNLVAQNPAATSRVIKAVKKCTGKPVIAKLSPNVTDVTVIARAAEDAGADALSLVNTFAAMAVDIEARQPVLGNITGGLSGPAIKPMAVRIVYDTARSVGIPIIATGGIINAADALEFIIAGATAVAVGTGNFVNPRAPLEIIAGIRGYMKRHKMQNITQLIGSIQLPKGRRA